MKNLLLKYVLSLVLVVCMISVSQAANIGNWTGSGRSWNNSDMTTLRAALLNAGHTVEADGAISTADLADNNIFVIGEPNTSPAGAEISALTAFVSNGGILIVLVDSGCSPCTGANAVLSGIGSSMSFSGNSASVSSFPSGVCATDGPPYNLVGQTLDTTPGTEILGGTAIAGSFAHYEQIGSGLVFTFGDRSDHNLFNPDASHVNGQLFLNIADCVSAPPPPTTTVPTMTEWGMIFFIALAGIGSIYYLRRKRTVS